MIQLEYNLTRPFPVRWLAPLAFTGAAIGFVILVILNTGLTAYQLETEASPNFNATWWFWYSPLVPPAARNKGGNCDPVLMGTGTVVSTNKAIFTWTIDRVIKSDSGRSGFKYTGFDLDSCDITTVNFDGSITTHAATVKAFARCNPSPEVAFSMSTTFSLSELSTVDTILGASTEGSPSLGYAGKACNGLLGVAGNDLLEEYKALNLASPQKIVLFTASTRFPFCPASNSSNLPCSSTPPVPTFETAGLAFDNGTFVWVDPDNPDVTGQVLNDVTRGPIINLHQIVAACVRVDLGQNNTNNILLNPTSAVPSGIIIPQFPAAGTVPAYDPLLATVLNNVSLSVIDGVAQLPVPWTGDSVFDVAFLCRIKQWKSPGEAFIGVLVATLSMFMSGWAIFMFSCNYILKSKHGDESNYCIGHHNQTVNQMRPQPYTIPSGMSDYSNKTSAIPLAMPSPEPMTYSGNGYQYQPASTQNY